MSGTNVNANDTMVRRLEAELHECKVFTNGLVERANTGQRDLSEQEKELMAEKGARMTAIKGQLDQLEEIQRVGTEVTERARVVDHAISTARGKAIPEDVEKMYRSAGSYVLDMYGAYLGQREAQERLDVFNREAAHFKSSDATGLVPDPIIGKVLNFIDASRPIVSLLGAQPLPSEKWHRPKVTQHGAVAKQGTNGKAADQKTELTSQKMVISRLDAEAVTYGGYVNVAKQTIDFSQPGTLDLIINDLASEYAIETEAATAAALAAVATSAVSYTATDGGTVAAALWEAAANVFSAVRGQGRLVLFVAPDRLRTFGPLFSPVGPMNQQGEGFLASKFSQGVMGTISGIPTVMSAGLDEGEAFLASTAAVEVYEQRVGALQVVEPSVLGIQVAYAGYFAPLVVEAGGVVPLSESGS